MNAMRRTPMVEARLNWPSSQYFQITTLRTVLSRPVRMSAVDVLRKARVNPQTHTATTAGRRVLGVITFVPAFLAFGVGFWLSWRLLGPRRAGNMQPHIRWK